MVVLLLVGHVDSPKHISPPTPDEMLGQFNRLIADLESLHQNVHSDQWPEEHQRLWCVYHTGRAALLVDHPELNQ